MSSPQILNEYLVRLGFDPDRVGYARFVNALRDVESQVNNRYFNMIKKVAEFEFATLGAFGAIGAGTLGFMDRVAMADQQYRLFALHMYTSMPVARELKVALDALGQPLENVMWDQELAERFHQLVKDQEILTEQLGPGFEQNMRRIRDVRFEFTRFGVELKYLGMEVVNDLFKVFGKGGDDLLANLQHLNAWFQANIPFFAYWITTKLKPALADIGQVFKTIWDEVKSINLNTVADDVQKLVKALAQASELMVHLVAGAIDLGEGKFKDAWGELKSSGAVLTPGSGAALGAQIGGAAGLVFGGPSGAAIGAGIGAAAGLGIGAAFQKTGAPGIEDAARYVAEALGIPRDVILAHWAYETGGFSHIAAANNLAGIKVPGTDQFQSFSSLTDFAQRYIDVLRSNRYLGGPAGLVPPQTIKDFAEMLENGGYAPDRTTAQYAAGMAHYGDIYVTVHATTTATPDEIAHKIEQVLQESLRRPPKSDNLQIQRNINEFQTPGWSYGG